MGLFVTKAEDFAILREVKAKLDWSLFDGDENLKKKVDEIAPALEKWVGEKVPWRMRWCYYGWINYYRASCRERIKDRAHWRRVDKAKQNLPAMPN